MAKIRGEISKLEGKNKALVVCKATKSGECTTKKGDEPNKEKGTGKTIAGEEERTKIQKGQKVSKWSQTQ